MDSTALSSAIAPASAGGEVRAARLDLVLLTAVVAVALAVGWLAASAAAGEIPAQNAMFDADTGRVLGNLTGVSDNYYRLKVHPWQGWICIFYQQVVAHLLPPQLGVPLLSVAIAAACAGLVFVVLRRLDVDRWSAASHAVLFCSTAGYVFWSTLPESHMAGGVSTLAAVLLADERRRVPGWRTVAALAVSFSMVVTNAAVWLFQQAAFEPRAPAARLVRLMGWSVGLIVLVWAPQWLFLRKRIGIPFNFLEERHYVEVGSGTWNSSLHIFGIVPPDSGAALVLALVAVAVLIVALRLLPAKLWFVPLFPLFGVVLHAVYGSESSFLFAPNYLPLFVVALALVMARKLPRAASLAVLPVAALLLMFNLQQWQAHINTLQASGQMKSYAAAVHY